MHSPNIETGMETKKIRGIPMINTIARTTAHLCNSCPKYIVFVLNVTLFVLSTSVILNKTVIVLNMTWFVLHVLHDSSKIDP